MACTHIYNEEEEKRKKEEIRIMHAYTRAFEIDDKLVFARMEQSDFSQNVFSVCGKCLLLKHFHRKRFGFVLSLINRPKTLKIYQYNKINTFLKKHDFFLSMQTDLIKLSKNVCIDKNRTFF